MANVECRTSSTYFLMLVSISGSSIDLHEYIYNFKNTNTVLLQMRLINKMTHKITSYLLKRYRA
jgi:hypothetical protein